MVNLKSVHQNYASQKTERKYCDPRILYPAKIFFKSETQKNTLKKSQRICCPNTCITSNIKDSSLGKMKMKPQSIQGIRITGNSKYADKYKMYFSHFINFLKDACLKQTY